MPRSFPPSRAAERRCRPRGKLRPKAEKQFLKTLAQVIGPLRRRKTRGFPTFRAHEKYMPSEPHGEGDIAVELWKKLEPGEK